MLRRIFYLIFMIPIYFSGCMRAHVSTYNRGIMAYENADYSAAIDCFQRSLTLKSSFPEAYYGAGLTLYKLGRFEEAESELMKGLAIKTSDADFFMALGLVQYQLNKKELALISFKKSYEMRPTPDNAFNLGLVLRELGQAEKALPLVLSLRKATPQSVEILENIGLCYKDLGKQEEAENNFTLAASFAADESQKQQLLSNLKSRENAAGQRPASAGEPSIVIYSPADEGVTFEDNTKLEAKVYADAGVADISVFLNGNKFQSERGMLIEPAVGNINVNVQVINTFIPLTAGNNEIMIQARDASGAVSRELVKVVRNKPKLFGLFIGISRYADQGIPSLNYAKNDAEELYQLFNQQTVFESPQLRLLVNEQATRANITEGLAYFLSKAAPHDLAIIFLAGHGIQEAGEYFFIPYDAVKANLFGTAVKDVEFASSMKRIAARRLILLTDTCHSGGILTATRSAEPGTGAHKFFQSLTKAEGRMTISASEFNEISLEDARLQHGVFSYYLLEGLNGAADSNQDNMIGVMELYRYISEKIPDVTRGAQHPLLLVPDGRIMGDMPIANIIKK